MRKILPPTWTLVTFGIVYLLLEGFRQFISRVLPPDEIDWFLTRQSLVVFACCLYGAFRIASTHPAFHKDYLTWLRSTPWNAKQPLPKGPVHMVWQDAVILGVAELFACRSANFHPAYPLIAFFLCNTLVLTLALLLTRTFRVAGAVVFALGLVILTWLQPWMCLLTTVVVCGLAHLGFERCLKEFPWLDPARRPSEESSLLEKTHQLTSAKRVIPWPFNALRPVKPLSYWTLEVHLWTSLLAGWYAIVFLQTAAFTSEVSPSGPEARALISAAMLIPWFRVLVWWLVIAPPISLLGRLFTGRLIIAGYDYILVFALLTSVMMFTAWKTLEACSLPPFIIAGILLALGIFLALRLGPGPVEWELTGARQPRAIFTARQANTIKI
jgi:hypothetical protein